MHFSKLLLLPLVLMTSQLSFAATQTDPVNNDPLKLFHLLRSIAPPLSQSATIIPYVYRAQGHSAIISWAPNDRYFTEWGSVGPADDASPYYQWGLKAMNFEQAWDRVRGHAQIGLLELGYPGTINSKLEVSAHSDLRSNYREQFVSGKPRGQFGGMKNGDALLSDFVLANDHATHVAGIIAAEANNGGSYDSFGMTGGIAGGCVHCSLTAFASENNTFLWDKSAQSQEPSVSTAIRLAVDTGMQVVNWSGHYRDYISPASVQCNYNNENKAICDALLYAKNNGVLIVEAVGNYNMRANELPFPVNLASQFSILPVGGTERMEPFPGWNGSRWEYWGNDKETPVGYKYDKRSYATGSNYATLNGVIAPAKNIVSTIGVGSKYGSENWVTCGDTIVSTGGGGTPSWLYPPVISLIYDASGTKNDGFGTCTGTSMAAPHITALAGLILSVNPRLTPAQVMNIIRQSGNLATGRTDELGYGMPNAVLAVDAALATNPRRLTPLFSFYSQMSEDSFYTTVPQMGRAAIGGTLMPRNFVSGSSTEYYKDGYESAYGTPINGYPSFPGLNSGGASIGPAPMSTPLAQVWLFTTHENPLDNYTPLEPIYRLSWKCGDKAPNGVSYPCKNNRHMDTLLATESEIQSFKNVGYKIDGLEGYLYSKDHYPPAGTVQLIRAYHSSRDDYAIFPESQLTAMSNQGYSQDIQQLGYVYPNVAGDIPVIE